MIDTLGTVGPDDVCSRWEDVCFDVGTQVGVEVVGVLQVQVGCSLGGVVICDMLRLRIHRYIVGLWWEVHGLVMGDRDIGDSDVWVIWRWVRMDMMRDLIHGLMLGVWVRDTGDGGV